MPTTSAPRIASVAGALALAWLLPVSAWASASETDVGPADGARYTAPSRFTDPGDRAVMLEVLPDEPTEIAEVARNLTVHHNLLAHLGVPNDRWPEVRIVWPPKAPDALAALSETGPGDLLGERQVTDRLRGACMTESHLLTAMLRHREIPVRIRAGYFRDVYTNADHLIAFWEKNARAKGVARELLAEDPERWREVNHEYTWQQIDVNKSVEHWVAEYWDGRRQAWRLLDANTTFLEAMSDIDVGFHLPRRHFQYAHEAWRKMRTAPDFDPRQYAEWPQDGRSHVRAQLLWDFYSLLNHDIAGYDKARWPDDEQTSTPERDVYAFVKETTYEEVSAEELTELDALAELLAGEPAIDDLVAFYQASEHLRIPTLEADDYSFPNRQRELDRLIERFVDAIGGYEAIKSLRNLVYSGGLYQEGDYTGEGDATMHLARPYFKLVGDKTRGYAEGYDGSAWEWLEDPGIVVRTVGPASEAIRHYAGVEHPLIDYRAKGSTASLVGDTVLDGRAVTVLSLVRRDGFAEQFYIDKETHLINASGGTAPIHAFGDSVVQLTRISDYRPVAGVAIAHRFESVELPSGKALSSMQWGKIEANLDLPADWFSPPRFERTPLQAFVEHLYGQRADLESVMWTYYEFRRGHPGVETVDAVNVAAYQSLKMGAVDTAIALLEQNARDHPDSPDVRFGLGRAYRTAERIDEARAEFRAALEIDPEHARSKRALESLP